MEKSGLSFENSLKFRTMRQQKHNSDNTLPSLYDFNVEKVETLSYLESILSTEASNNSTCFSGLTPRENFEKESNQKFSKLPLLKNYKDKLLNNADLNKKIGSFNKEVVLEKKRAEIEEKIKEIKISKKKLLENRSNLKLEIESGLIELNILRNFDNFYNMNDIYKKKVEYLNETYKKHTKKTVQKRASMEIELLKITSNQQKVAHDRSNLYNDKKQFLAFKEEQRNKITETIKEKEEELKNYKTELLKIKNTLLLHYHEILKEGRDARHDGLCWIIIAIWNMGFNIISSYIPKFLDPKSINYLFELSILEIELRNINKEIDNLKEKYKANNLQSLKIFSTTLNHNNEKKKEITPQSQKHLSILKEKFIKDHSFYEKLNLRSIESIIKDYNEPNQSLRIFIQKLSDLKQLGERKIVEKENLRDEEIKRINQEFLLNDYEKRFNIKLQDVLIALIGVDNAHVENNLQNEELRKFYQKKAHIRTYNFLDSEDNQFSKAKRLKDFKKSVRFSLNAGNYGEDLNKDTNI